MNATSISQPTGNDVRKPSLTRFNQSFTVTWDEDGTLAAIVLNGDAAGMNWIGGTDRWGAIRLHRMEYKGGIDTWGDTTRMAFAGMREEGNAVISTCQALRCRGRQGHRGDRGHPALA